MILHFESRLNSPQYKLRFEDWLMLSFVGKESHGCRPLLSFIGGPATAAADQDYH